MKVRTKKWLIRASAIAVVAFLGLVVAAYFLSKRYEPQIRQQTIRYLEKRFSSEAEIKALHIVLLPASPRTVLFEDIGALVRVEGEGVLLRHQGRRDLRIDASFGRCRQDCEHHESGTTVEQNKEGERAAGEPVVFDDPAGLALTL